MAQRRRLRQSRLEAPAPTAAPTAAPAATPAAAPAAVPAAALAAALAAARAARRARCWAGACRSWPSWGSAQQVRPYSNSQWSLAQPACRRAPPRTGKGQGAFPERATCRVSAGRLCARARARVHQQDAAHLPAELGHRSTCCHDRMFACGFLAISQSDNQLVQPDPPSFFSSPW
eukprot:6806213-Prymnesium_polylepis.2